MPPKRQSPHTKSLKSTKSTRSQRSEKPSVGSSQVVDQNSDLDSGAHSSGARIEEMYRNIRPGEPTDVEITRPSEREPRYHYESPEEPAEGSREDV